MQEKSQLVELTSLIKTLYAPFVAGLKTVGSQRDAVEH